jgi:putative endonuclease
MKLENGDRLIYDIPMRGERGEEGDGMERADKAAREETAATGHFVYIAECADGSLYTGYTNDVEKRIRAHNDGKGAKYTRSRLPVKAVYTEECANKEAAFRREAQIKKLRRENKLRLIAEGRRRDPLP